MVRKRTFRLRLRCTEGQNFTIANKGNGILSLTNLKITFKDKPDSTIALTPLSTEEQNAAVMSVRALFAAPEQTFEPEHFTAKWSRNVRKGGTATLTVKASADVEAIKDCTYPGTELKVSEVLPEKVMSIGENLQIRRFVRFAENTSVGYVHAGGKIGVLVNLAVEGGVDATEIGKNVAMQIAALNPRFWDKSQVTEDVLAEEKKVALALMDSDPKMASKPAQVKEKIVMGKMNKFYEENCLLQMEFVRGDLFSGTVEQYIADAGKKLGGSVKFLTAVRYQTGEGIEKKEENFAAEVAAQMNQGK